MLLRRRKFSLFTRPFTLLFRNFAAKIYARDNEKISDYTDGAARDRKCTGGAEGERP
jgi:hypothetical protein